MTFSQNQFLNKIQSKLIESKLREHVIIFIISFLIAVPTFLFFRKNIYHFESDFFKTMIFVLIILTFFILLKKFRTKLIYSLIAYIAIFIIATIQGNYNLFQVINAYKVIFFSDEIQKEEAIVEQTTLKPFPNKEQVFESVDYINPKVRNFALYAVNKHFTKTPNYAINRKFIQYFAVFKEINKRWNYVNDPKGQEYFARGSESLLYFSGDCDDHAILMCAAIKSIGGSMRLIHTGRHMYPELLIGTEKDLEAAIYLINKELFTDESKNKTIYFHRDENGKIWLNLDYTAHYPGGPFLGEEVLGVLNLQETTKQSAFFQ